MIDNIDMQCLSILRGAYHVPLLVSLTQSKMDWYIHIHNNTFPSTVWICIRYPFMECWYKLRTADIGRTRRTQKQTDTFAMVLADNKFYPDYFYTRTKFVEYSLEWRGPPVVLKMTTSIIICLFATMNIHNAETFLFFRIAFRCRDLW